MSPPAAAAWPEPLFAAPVLRGLDPAGRRAIEDAGRLRPLPASEACYAAGELADSFFVVERGEIELRASGRGLDSGETRIVRVVRAGETFGEEATLPNARRLYSASARVETRVAEIPVALFRRALGRSGQDEREGPEHRLLRRRFTADLLRGVAFVRTLAEPDFDLLLDAASEHEFDRGERVFSRGDPPDGLWLIAQGLVQLQRETDEGKIQVSAYLSDGDLFGDAELLDARPRTQSAVAMGGCRMIRISPLGFRQLADRNPGLLASLRRVTEQRATQQAAIVEQAPHSTRHVFADLYRMQMARSLLTIDQDTCVRCGHCAWSCEQLHGVARLVRRGDKVVTRLRVIGASKPGAGRIHDLLLPNSCQHCQNPVCMIDCPTGAIGRDAAGEVFIREALCTGCGNCAKACPWENIRMAPRKLAGGVATKDQFAPALVAAADRKHQALEQMFPAVATKCDLCRDYEAPACVQSCPTGSLIRLEPQRDFAEVAALLGASNASPTRTSTRWRESLRSLALALVATLGLAVAIAGAGLHRVGALQAGFGWGLGAGYLAAFTMLGLVAHALPKRVLSLWMRRRDRSGQADRARLLDETPAAKPLARSRVRPFYLAHIGLGLVLPGMLLAHAGGGAGADPVAASLLGLAWATLLIGLFGAASHALLPRRLAALERRGALPEDLVHEREHLLDRLQRELSGRSNLVKRMTADFLLPWARKPFGGLALLVLGRELGDQQARLRARIDAALPEGQADAEALAGIDECIRICVELRALPARRLANALLRNWLMPHVLLTGALLVALIAHVLLVSLFALA